MHWFIHLCSPKKSEEVNLGTAISFGTSLILDIKRRSLIRKYSIFELSTVWLQSSTGRIKSNKMVCSIYTSDERE